MTRAVVVNGEALVTVKGSSSSAIASLSELGLASDSIRITPNYFHEPVNADAWGNAPFEMQYMLETASISMTLVQFDRNVVAACLCESKGGSLSEGQLKRAGTLLGNGAARFSATNHYIGLNISSPVEGLPWRFFYAFLTGPPIEIPLSTKKALYVLNWMAIPYTSDPWQLGLGAEAYYIFDHTADN